MAYEEQDYNKRAFEWPVWKSILPYLKMCIRDRFPVASASFPLGEHVW